MAIDWRMTGQGQDEGGRPPCSHPTKEDDAPPQTPPTGSPDLFLYGGCQTDPSAGHALHALSTYYIHTQSINGTVLS